jgi:tetratricopeptide (TPR) repeat protein/ADP-heptose:LPS heptosyltransferase
VRTAFASLLGGDGRWAELEDFAALCLARDPQDAAAHDHLGIARQFQNDAAGAVVHHQRSLALRPDHAPSWLNLGNALQRLGQLGDAIACYERAMAQRPEDATLLRNLGQALLRADEPEAALARFQQVLALRSEKAEAWNDLGQVLFRLGELHDALAAFRKALELQGDDPDLLCNVGTTLQKLGENGAAETYLQRALERRPDFVEAWNNLGVTLENLQRLPEGIEHLRRALTLRPNYADGYANLGNALMRSRNFPGALDSFRSALALCRDHGDAHHNYGMALLLLGDYRRGWAEYEWRGRCSRPVQPHALPPTPVWDGRPLPPGQTLLLVSEQGLGDTLQFMRYALTLRQQGVPVRLAVQSKLHGILQASGIDPQPLHPEQGDSFSDGPWLPLLSLPGILGVSPDTPLHNDPYIHTTPERLRHWQQRLANAPRPLVAIGWQGNPDHETSSARGRSLPLESLSPLAQRTDITFLSLQKGFGAEQLASCSFRHRFLDIQSEIDQAWDFLDAAAILACCDLVLTSDTALAHLAGGMGRPTWLLLQNLPEWRWGLQGDSSPWYPSLRIFRQSTPGDWTSLLHHVADEFLSIQQIQALLAPPGPESPAGISAAAEAEQLFQLGNTREEQGDPAGAIAAWRRALELRPDYPEALNNLALTLHEQGDPRTAITTFQEALRRHPAFVAARFNLGNALQEVGALDEAIACFQQTLALQGDLAEAHLNLGSALQERGDRAAARASFEAVLRLRPDDADAHGNLALLDLLEGNYNRGWPGSEWRFRGPAGLALLIARPAGPRWGGEVLPAGTSLLLVAEQGLGDTLQFVRYLPLLRQRGMAVRLCAPPALHRLLEASGLESDPLTPAEGQKWNGPWLPLLSLPGLLGVSRERPLVQAPYLQIPEELVASWRRRLAGERRPLLALHWQGNPEHERRHARGRSLPLDTFAPLARSGEATFLSLQKGFGAEQLAACPFRDRFVAAQEEIDQTWDFLETAAILSACDRLICADSGVAHLAGGLGHPTWLLLKDIPDWRWGLEGESSFWYPSGLRLFRQRRRGDWGEVMERVAAALKAT